MIVVDVETTGLDPHTDRIVGYAINGQYETETGWIRPLLDGKGLTCHNGNFDIKFLWNAGAQSAYVEFDTMIAAYLLKDRPESLSLGSCAEFYLGHSSDWKNAFKGSALEMDPQLLAEYCLKDVDVTSKLRVELEGRLKKEGLWDFFNKLMKARNLLSRAEYKGMNVDWTALKKLEEQLSLQEADLLRKLNEENGELINEWQKEEQEKRIAKLKRPEKAKKKEAPPFNWSSPKQVLWALKKVGADVLITDPKTKEIKESSNTTVLQRGKRNHKFCDDLLQLRGATKTLGMLRGYAEGKNPLTNALHGKFNLTVTATGRLSSSEPNLQNIDSGPEIRSLFVPSPGKTFVIADLAQIEVRLAAHYSRDPALIKMFEEGEDFYGTIATGVLGVKCSPKEVKERFPEARKVAKVIGLSILYGTGAKRLKEAIKTGTGRDFSEDECRSIIKNYFKTFKGLKELQKRVERVLLERGYITNLFGRKLWVAPEDIYMHGVNYLLQSSASDLMLLRQVEMDNNKSALIALVHDEVIRECAPQDVEEVKAEMERVLEQTADIGLRVPLKTDAKACNNWAEGK